MTFHRYVDGNRERTVQFTDGFSVDAFGRARISEPATIFETKQIFDNAPLLYSDQQVSGTATTSTFSTLTASTVIGVTSGNVGRRDRASLRNPNYQPGKSQLYYFTGDLPTTGAGQIARIGCYGDDNGICFESRNGVYSVVIFSKTSGTVTADRISQGAWNIDTLDGSGVNDEKGLLKNPSKIQFDGSKVQLFAIDFAWLGTSRVRLGMKFGGNMVYIHEFLNANVNTECYMSTPNNKLRYSVENLTTTAGDLNMKCICSAVMSEGGNQELGTTTYISNEGTHIDATTGDSLYALIGIRLKSTHLGATVKIKNATIISETNDDTEWMLLFNPVLDTALVWADETNSALESSKANGQLISSVGKQFGGGYLTASQSGGAQTEAIETEQLLGSSVDGTRDVIVLAARPLGAGTVNADISGGLTVKEII
jgi:hypothetical protein